MKLGQFFKKMVGGSVILAAFAGPIFTSCYDDSKLWGEMESLKDRVTSLEERLNDELAALQYMLGADAKIKDVKWNETAKKWEFTLADNSILDFVPPTAEDFQSLITTVEEDGVKYWATYGADGTASALTDAEGNKYPVTVTPQVKTEDNTTYLSLDGENWVVVSVANPAIFTDVNVVYTDNYTDEEEAEGAEETPMYATFTLADGNTITLTLDGAGIISIGDQHGISPTYDYIPFGATVEQRVDMLNISDYIVQVPTGWSVSEKKIEEYNETYLVITAPTEKAVADKMAQAEGDIKILGVSEGGKPVTAKSFVTTNAFSRFTATKGVITIEPRRSVNAYLLGVAPASSWNAEESYSALKQAFDEAGSPYSMWDYTSVNGEFIMSMAEGSEWPEIAPLTVGESYVVWAAACTMNSADYTWSLGSMMSSSFTYVSVDIQAVPTFKGIQMTAEMGGTEGYYAGFSNKEYFYGIEDVLSSFSSPWDAPMLVPYTSPFSGSVMEFVPDAYEQIGPGKEYILWVIPAIEGKTSYTADDVYMYEFMTPAITAGGTKAVTLGDDTANAYNRFSVGVTSADAEMIYTAWILPENISTTPDLAEYVLTNGIAAFGGETTAITSYLPGGSYTSITAGTTLTLLALAVDSEGKHGEVAYKNYTTKNVSFNDIVVTLTMVGETSVEGTKFKVETSSASGLVPTGYLVYAGSAYESRWMNTYGGSAATAEKYFAMNPEYHWAKQIQPDQDGIITVPSEAYLKDFVICVSAKAEVTVGEGETAKKEVTVSRAGYQTFQVMFDLGADFVNSKDQNGNDNPVWVAAKPNVTCTFVAREFAEVTWSVDVPDGFTGYTYCIHPDYLTNYPTGKDKANYFLVGDFYGETKHELVAGSEYYCPSASDGYLIYVLLKDAQGNYYEPYEYDFEIKDGYGI